MKPGMWTSEHVGVIAPGTAKRTTFLPSNSSRVEMSTMPLWVICLKLASGIGSPVLMLMDCSLVFLVSEGAAV